MKLYWALGASLLTHLLFVEIARRIPSPDFLLPQNETLEFVVVPESEIPQKSPDSQQIVRQALAPEKLKVQEETHPARFKSEQTQRVSEEVQAQHDGLTENRQPLAQVQNSLPQQDQQKELNPNHFQSTEQRLREWQNLNNISQNSGYSTRGDRLPDDVRIGHFTALNTDQYLFYSFYARIEELVRFRWTHRVLEARELFPVSLATQYPQRSEWTTEVLFKLDSRGKLVAAILMKESGYPGFDLAAIKAFQEAGTFPNPPPELKKTDGLIHLIYGFTVRFQPRFLSQENK